MEKDVKKESLPSNWSPFNGGKWRLRNGLFACFIALPIALTCLLAKQKADLKTALEDKESDAAELFHKRDSACFCNDQAWYALDEEMKIDMDALATSEEWSMEKYQNISTNLEKKMIGDVKNFVKAIKNNFAITSEERTNEFWEIWYDVKIENKTGEDVFEYEGKQYSWVIDDSENTIECTVTDFETWEELGTVEYRAIQWDWVDNPSVNAAEITCYGSGCEAIFRMYEEQILERNVFYYGHNDKRCHQTDSIFVVYECKTERERVFDAETWVPLEWTYEVSTGTGESMEWNFINWFAEWPVRKKLEGNNIHVEGTAYHGRLFWRWKVFYHRDNFTDDWKPAYDGKSVIFPWRFWGVVNRNK